MPRNLNLNLYPPPPSTRTGTQPGDLLRLERAGIAHSSEGAVSRGSHFFQVSVEMPDAGQLPEGGPELRALAALHDLLAAPSAA